MEWSGVESCGDGHSDSREDGHARLELIDQLSTGFSFARLTRLSAAPDWGPQIEASLPSTTQSE